MTVSWLTAEKKVRERSGRRYEAGERERAGRFSLSFFFFVLFFFGCWVVARRVISFFWFIFAGNIYLK